MSKKCRAFSASKLGLEPADNRKAFYAGWDAALEQPEQEQEPVAWMSPGKERLEFSRPDTVYGSHTVPLYKNPTPCQTCLALARAAMMDQTSHDTHPPRREWQGLTEKEIKAMYDDCDADTGHAFVFAFARAIEAALKERNA